MSGGEKPSVSPIDGPWAKGRFGELLAFHLTAVARDPKTAAVAEDRVKVLQDA